MAAEENKNISLKITELVDKAREGNRWSFQELVSIYQEDIYRFVYYRTFSQMDAEDITQEIFVQAYRKINSLNDSRKFRSWLYSIAVNRCNDFLRKKRYLTLLRIRSAQEQELTGENRGMGKDDNGSMEKAEFWKKVRSLVNKLSTMEREVFTLRFMDHRNINEIATILDKSESTVKTHLYRALNKVRKDSGFFQEFRESLS
ncbi:MAG: RNA polymerase sigma factor [Deltaproteobacteria bacterium]|jgi:RNA polymerase sigma-70 factor (ECF subfamily)|nr:RNA polymerase sigma factor [Deltaproteobacteria bacterium]